MQRAHIAEKGEKIMKKIKKFAASLLCLLMSGTMLFSVGCGGNGDDSSVDNSVPTGGSESVGGETVGEKPSAGVADKAAKKYFYNALVDTVGSMETNPTQTIQLTLDLDIKIVAAYETETDVEITTISDMEFDAVAYGKYVNDVLAVDVLLDGKNDLTENGETRTAYMYLAEYIRGDDLYVGQSESDDAPITQADKDEIVYDKGSLSAIIEAIMSDLGIAQGTAPDNSVDTVAATEEETEPDWQAILMENQDLIVKAASNIASGLSANVEVDGDVLTLVLDFKKEAESLITVMENVASAIGENTSLNDLLNNQQLAGLFNKYLGDITAAEMQQVLLTVLPLMEAPEEIMAAVQAPEAGASGYQYLVKTLCAFPISDTEVLGEQVFVEENKAEFVEMIGMAKAYLAEVNALKFTMSVENGEFRGISLDIDINNVVDTYFSMVLDMGVSYEFKDVTTLEVYQAE